jgi:ArsR family transcriptional regulator
VQEERQSGGGGWVVGSSIAGELDMALTAVGGYFVGQKLPADLGTFTDSIPQDWLADWSLFLGPRRRMVSVLEQAAFLAGVLVEDDYSRATLAMRQLDASTALAWIHATFPGSVEGSDTSDASAALVDTLMRLLAQAHGDVGFPGFEEEAIGRYARDQLGRLTRILKDGDLHARFWHWLDRFCYQHYLPWRETRAEDILQAERHVVEALGARRSASTNPELSWLPRLNPLNHHAPLAEAVHEGRLRVFFWVEPFGIPDAWALWPGLVSVSTSQADDLLDNFRRFAGDVATRVQALGDPTRLVILRMIRHMGIPNSSIARYLGLSQPTVSVHVKVLRDAGFVRSRKEGRTVRHEVVVDEVERLFRDLDRLLDLPSDGPAAQALPPTSSPESW